MNTKLTQKEAVSRDEFIKRHRNELYRLVNKTTTVDVNDENELVEFMNMAINKIEDTLIHAYDTALQVGVEHERKERAFYANYGK